MQHQLAFYEFVGFKPAIASPDDLSHVSIDTDTHALLLDFDGTFADIAATPDAVKVARSDLALLNQLAHRFDDAVAIVSGRNLDDVAAYLSAYEGTISGGHGCEFRENGQTLREAAHDAERLEHIKNAVFELAIVDPRVIAEDKTFGIALHFRQNPEVEGKVRNFIDCLIGDDPDFEIQQAKMALEVKPKGISKAMAIERIMQSDAFRGRTMVYAGDDDTDEAAFAYVNDHDGISVKVGDGPTIAHHRVATPRALKLWLRRQGA